MKAESGTSGVADKPVVVSRRKVELVPTQKPSKKEDDTKAGFTAILDGYTFEKDKNHRLASIDEMRHYWHCLDKNCKARLITNDDDEVFNEPKHGDHDPPKKEVWY
jgi:hypothetical protein